MPTHVILRKVFGDFARLSRYPDADIHDQAIPLGDEERIPALKQLGEGERVLVVEWGELRAEATVTRRERNGRAMWFAHELGTIEEDVPATLPEDTISPISTCQ